jgi:phosphatidate phosphatase PAH1
MEGQSSRIEQTEDRTSELEDEMVIKGKTKELLIKQLKTCEKKMQELTDSIKRIELPNDMLSLKQQAQKLGKNIEGCKREKTSNIQR